MKVEKVQPKNAADVTDEVLKAWKNAYPTGVFMIAIDTDEITGQKEISDRRGKPSMIDVYAQKVGYVRKPNRMELAAAMSIQNDPLGQAEDLFRSSWLGGDQELLDNDEYFTAALLQYQEVMQVRTGEIKKL